MADTRNERRRGWGFARGDEIAPGRTVQSLLGGGERCEAYLAWNHRLMVPTVLKVLRPGVLGDGRARRSLRREGELLARLRHPGLTRMLDVVADGDRPFVEIEYVEGPRLSTLVRRHGRLSAEQACDLGHQLAATLDHLHAEGVLHLDVKPSNVIMGPIPRLIDLSVARTVDRVPSITGHVGTDAYMAPEQADPSRWATIGPATDAWGLAATLYYTISRRTPHSRGDRGAAGPARFPQLVERPAPLDTVRHAPGLVELLMSTLVPEPAHRPSMKELVGRFDELARRARRDEARPWRPGLASSRRGGVSGPVAAGSPPSSRTGHDRRPGRRTRR